MHTSDRSSGERKKNELRQAASYQSCEDWDQEYRRDTLRFVSSVRRRIEEIELHGHGSNNAPLTPPRTRAVDSAHVPPRCLDAYRTL